MKCWICGDEATTGEHKVKASDHRSVIGRGKLYLHTDNHRNQPVQGINSGKLKYGSKLCEQCNSKRTQEHDRAWDLLSNFLRARKPPIRPNTTANLSRVFRGSVHKSMLNVHLYFLKLFGCRISEGALPFDLQEFADCILQSTAHPCVHLSFIAETQSALFHMAGQTPIRAVRDAYSNDRVVFATWLYQVGRLSVNVMYAEPAQHRKGLAYAWHPSTVSKVVHITG